MKDLNRQVMSALYRSAMRFQKPATGMYTAVVRGGKMDKLSHMRSRALIVTLVLSIAIVAPSRGGEDTFQKEADRLALLLNWQHGSHVADVGAGSGELALASAKVVGSTGQVYATELDAKKLAHLQEIATKESNLTVLKAAEAQTNLPAGCCDSIFMRLVYHHLTKPAEIDSSLLQSLKPGGLLAVIDREPPPGSKILEGVPENRGGHGVPEKILIEELTAAGFNLVKSLDDWPDNRYCVIFRKPRP